MNEYLPTSCPKAEPAKTAAPEVTINDKAHLVVRATAVGVEVATASAGATTAVIYQYRRANILREMLIDVTAAYNIATGQPTRRLSVPPVVDPGVSPTSGTESDSEEASKEDGYNSCPLIV